jgi:hypothetical protein
VGLEASLTALNNELAILPIGLSLTHGIVTHLNLPALLPAQVAFGGALLALLGWTAARLARPQPSRVRSPRRTASGSRGT